jgi:hypothetical protein
VTTGAENSGLHQGCMRFNLCRISDVALLMEVNGMPHRSDCCRQHCPTDHRQGRANTDGPLVPMACTQDHSWDYSHVVKHAALTVLSQGSKQSHLRCDINH